MHAQVTRWRAILTLALLLAASSLPAAAATKTIDLDAQAANGAESKCDLNVLQTFPVQIENVVTNRAVGNAFNFSWPSAGPGGFSSAAAPGTLTGVGAKWVWTTNQTVYAYTGTSCANDACFLKTAGPDSLPGTCTAGCGDDGVQLTVAKGATAGQVALTWAGGTAAYSVYRSALASTITASANRLTQTSVVQYTDTPPAGAVFFYRVRGTTCNAPKACNSNAVCTPSEMGICVSRGPFAVPGRSLFTTDITVSSASLTSSLITFFSPPTELFRITATAQPGAFQEIRANGGTTPVTATTDAYPPGCCPLNPDVPEQLNCDGTCVDYLNDPQNCGACGNVCGDGTCCTNGNCVSLCDEGEIWCNGECHDPLNDNANCAACGNLCGEGSCCVGGTCAPFVCDEGDDLCGGECVDTVNDNDHCGTCGNVCGTGTCCFEGACASVCEEGRTLCGSLCYDLQNDPNNCGTCGNVCNDTSICTGGDCVPCGNQGGFRDACDNRCVNLRTDPYNCGACGVSCNIGCPSDFQGVCSNGNSCSCIPGTPAPQPPSNIPPPTVPFCPNTNPPPDRTDPYCANPNPSGPTPEECPDPGPPAPPPSPVCVVDAASVTIPPGGTVTTCYTGGLLFKEVPTVVKVCGDGIPGPEGTCEDGVSTVTTGTFMRFVPDTDTPIGDAYLTTFAARVTQEDSKDGLIQPGETVSLLVDVVNAGPRPIAGATATLVSEPVDLTEDGVLNPRAMTVLQGSASFGTVQGTTPSENCEPVTLYPASSGVPFRFSVPADVPGDFAMPLRLQFTGTVDGEPFSMEVPFAIGIADKCIHGSGSGDYDGIDGLLSPMSPLVPDGDPYPYPVAAMNAGSTGPLKLKVLCGTVSLAAGELDPPEIVGIAEDVRGELSIPNLDLNDSANPDDPLFKWDAGSQSWRFQMRTENLGLGTFTLKIRLAGRKDYITRFVTQ